MNLLLLLLNERRGRCGGRHADRRGDGLWMRLNEIGDGCRRIGNGGRRIAAHDLLQEDVLLWRQRARVGNQFSCLLVWHVHHEGIDTSLERLVLSG